MSYKFLGYNYDTEYQRDRALCSCWLVADGWNHREDVKKTFESRTDKQLTEELLSDWEDIEADPESLIEMFGELRTELAECADPEDSDWIPHL